MEVATLRCHSLSESTQANYRSHLKTYLTFCQYYRLPPFPATTTTICRYIAYLNRSRCYGTIQQYLSVLRLMHLNFGLKHPLTNNYPVTALLQAVKRTKGNAPNYKLTISIPQLREIRARLNTDVQEDAQLWAVITSRFFGLLRLGNVTVVKTSEWDENKIVRRCDVSFSSKGGTLAIRHSKTNQYSERIFSCVLPRLNSDSSLCPALALINHLARSGTLPASAPLFAIKAPNGPMTALTSSSARRRINKLFKDIGLNCADYGSHSLRRSGASHLFACGMSLQSIMILGDWKSDCVLKYIKPVPNDKLDLLSSVLNRPPTQ